MFFGMQNISSYNINPKCSDDEELWSTQPWYGSFNNLSIIQEYFDVASVSHPESFPKLQFETTPNFRRRFRPIEIKEIGI